MTDRLTRDGEDYLNVMFIREYPQVLEEQGGRDPFGVYIKLTPEGFTPTEAVIDDIEDWENVVFHDPTELGIEEDAKNILNGFYRNKMMLRMDIPYGHLEHLWSAVGFENALIGFYTSPDETCAMLSTLTEYFIEKLALLKTLRRRYSCFSRRLGRK